MELVFSLNLEGKKNALYIVDYLKYAILCKLVGWCAVLFITSLTFKKFIVSYGAMAESKDSN